MAEPTQANKQNDISLTEEKVLQGQIALPLEARYQKLLAAYKNVCLERELLRKAIRVYALNSSSRLKTADSNLNDIMLAELGLS